MHNETTLTTNEATAFFRSSGAMRAAIAAAKWSTVQDELDELDAMAAYGSTSKFRALARAAANDGRRAIKAAITCPANS